MILQSRGAGSGFVHEFTTDWQLGTVIQARTGAPLTPFPLPVNIVLFVSAAGTVYFGLFPNQVLHFVLQSNLLGK